jgi:hypothetical protein
MIDQIKNILNKNFNKIIKCVKIMNNNNINGLYDNKQLIVYGEKNKAWIGKNVCGESCFITKYILEKNNYNIKVFRNMNYNSNHINDHCFLIVNNSTIVDITSKQFFIDERSNNINCLYNKYLFDLDPYFIGDYSNLNYYINEIIDKNKEVFSDIYFNKKYIISKWDMNQEITTKFDLGKCISDQNYLKDKPIYYKDIINIIK